jgi:hypothetical protein
LVERIEKNKRVYDGRFSLFRTQAKLGDAWRPASRDFFREAKRIAQVNEDEVILMGGPPMKRLPVESP